MELPGTVARRHPETLRVCDHDNNVSPVIVKFLSK
jgi:hypothetical protein